MSSSGAAHSIARAVPKQRMLTIFAWGVHLYTGLGAALGFLALYFAAEGDFRNSFIAMGVATFIDSSDGPLARLLNVKLRTPSFDGALLDNIVDYLTYVAAPVFLMIEAGIIPDDKLGLVIACFVMVAASYGFCQTNAKTHDHYFLGFPNYWNLIAFYLFCLEWGRFFNLAILLSFGILVFIPIRFIYPNRTVPLRPLTLSLGIAWAGITIFMLFMLPEVNRVLLFASLSFIAYYLAASLFLHARVVKAHR
ncbi:MAG TPA: CDP-alcohol phosphatidyltransferase family protein [Candidatus Binataceae bacterium]|nr:CDP-alcohol phosphatidyltransferase family protein [Candidatus Binataceae bacterium]